ncbi:MAG: O-antigen ligase family protein, partial [Gammaproteobacteria bacterium]|nr:O-antigen ligase family protein [Gammaproteobacteria bacterium]
GTRFTRGRYLASSFFICAVIGFPIFATIAFNSMEVNFFTALIQLMFCFCLLPEIGREAVSSFKESRVFRVCLVLMGVTVLGWFYLYIPFYGIYRTLVYVVQIPFFFALLAWFRVKGSDGLTQIFYVKLGVVSIAVLYMIYIYCGQDIDLWRKMIKGRPPIYRHLRHFNYDLAILIGLSAWLILKDKLSYKTVFGLFFTFGFLTFWSGARGQLLSLGVFFLLIMLSPQRIYLVRKFHLAVMAFLAGAVALVLSGETHMLLSSMSRSVEIEDFRRISSNRSEIWLATMVYVKDSLAFGYGPEALVRLNVWRGGIVQPHNFIVQFLLEFGATGTASILILLISSACMYISFILRKELLGVGLLGGLLMSLMIFALVDGVFYHIVPITMYLIIAAYVFNIAKSNTVLKNELNK